MHLTDKIATIESISRDVATIDRLIVTPYATDDQDLIQYEISFHADRIQYNCASIMKDYIEAENSNARRDALVRRSASNTAWTDRPSDTEGAD
jgi:hypothetical protein